MLPIAKTMKTAMKDFVDACKLVSANKLPEAITALRNLLHSILLTVAADKEEAQKVCLFVAATLKTQRL